MKETATIIAATLNTTLTTAKRIMKAEKLFLPLIAIFLTIKNSTFNIQLLCLAKILFYIKPNLKIYECCRTFFGGHKFVFGYRNFWNRNFDRSRTNINLYW